MITLIILTNRVTSEPSKQIGTMELQCWINTQYSRKECLEVVGIPHQFADSKLKREERLVFQNIGCNIDSTFTGDCHCLGKNNDRVIIKFICCNNFKLFLKAKKDLRNINMEDLD